MPTSSMKTSPFVQQAHYLSGGPAGLSIIQHLNVNWPPGVSWICGDEGSGKTTLLRLLAGDMSPTTGSVTVPSGGVFWIDLQDPAHKPAGMRCARATPTGATHCKTIWRELWI